MIDWVAVEDALVDWATVHSGGLQVILAEQTGARPTDVEGLVTLRIGASQQLAPLPELFNDTDLLRPNGTEINLVAKTFVSFDVTLTAYTEKTVGALTAFGALGRCRTALGLPSVRASLGEAGVSVRDLGQIQNVTAISHAAFEGRAVLTCRFYGLEEAIDEAGYIAEVVTEDYTATPPGTLTEIDI